MNPQIRFGEDLMSRVSYVMMNPGGEKEMTAAIREALNTLAAQVATRSRHRTQRHSGNRARRQSGDASSVPRHRSDRAGRRALCAGHRACRSPARPASSISSSIPAPRPMCCPASPAMWAPIRRAWCCRKRRMSPTRSCWSSMSAPMPKSCWARSARLLACSSPTGPAFEGAQISCGQRAAPGAIERIRIDPVTLEPRYKVIGCDLWSDEPGFEEAIAQTGVTGICGSGIIEAIAEMYLAGIINQDGLVDGSHGGAAARASSPTSAPSTMYPQSREGETADHASPRTTCAPSNWPRPHFMPACGC